MPISKEMLDELLKGCERSEDLLGDSRADKKARIKSMERRLGAERQAHRATGRAKTRRRASPTGACCKSSVLAAKTVRAGRAVICASVRTTFRAHSGRIG